MMMFISQTQTHPWLLRAMWHLQGRNEFTRNACFRASFNYSVFKTLWWRIRDSNPRPQACKARALPAELIPQLRELLAHKSRYLKTE
jgi:hypothetical protein